MKLFVLYFIRKHLGLKKYQLFQFTGQKDKGNFYYFSESGIIKLSANGYEKLSNVSLNWLLNDDCRIIKTDRFMIS